MEQKILKIFDLFCGTGAFSKGFENSSKGHYRTLLGLDVLPVAIETFKTNHIYSFAQAVDIRKVRRKEIETFLKVGQEDVDIIIGGPPCQGFSSIRPFRSSKEDDPRNSLFEEFASFVNYFRPIYFIIENVVGLATHNGGNTINEMQDCFYKIGYDCDWRIVNAANFGVPQRRERLFFIGAQKGVPLTFPKPTHYSNGSTIGYKDKSKVLAVEEDLFTNFLTPDLKPALTVMEAIGDLPPVASGEQIDKYVIAPKNDYQKDRRKRLDKLTLHSSTCHTKKMLEIIKHAGSNINSIPKHLITSGYSSCYSRLEPDKPSLTITVNFVHPASNRCIHPYQDRALTPREGARLQSFDDDFIFAGNRSQVTKQIGNAVPPLLGKIFAEELAQNF